ncbi:MAG: NAD-dependent epimerase/dehydratase family protein [Candidatus Nealsonbacteria bacterium]|nr:NAD-dependent epimerase/dehydratase family protein [Candidatus Nealsonbacteria bacterium]
MARCLVTGGAGFIGSNLVDALIAKGHEVLVIDNLSTGRRENLNSKAIFFEEDLLNFEKIKPIFEGVDFVFHEAALPRIPLSIEKPIETNDINIKATVHVLLAARDAKVKKVIYASSSSALGGNATLPMREDGLCNPLNPYALQKYVGELYCKIATSIYGVPTVSLRYFNVYGPRQPREGAYTPVIGVFLTQKKAGQPMTITGDGGQTRDFTHVFDVARANVLAMESDKVGKGDVINIGAGENHSVNEIAEMIGGESIHIADRPGEMRDTLADATKARELLGWQAQIELQDGIKQLLEAENG